MLDRILNRLEEWIIVTLIAAATILTFIAVVHRYGASNSASLGRWAGAHHLLLLQVAANWIYTELAAINLSWAQELATYMFVWMAKFGAALGVRTGIHVGVDVFVMQLTPKTRKPVIVFALLCGAPACASDPPRVPHTMHPIPEPGAESGADDCAHGTRGKRADHGARDESDRLLRRRGLGLVRHRHRTDAE